MKLLEIDKLRPPHFYVDQDNMDTLQSYCIVAQALPGEDEGYKIDHIYFIHNVSFLEGDCVYKVTEVTTEPDKWPVLFSETYTELSQAAHKINGGCND